MRREGKQHGVVRSCLLLSPNAHVVNKLDSLPTAGIFQKVSRKPTNHSKFTGVCRRPRCPGCHACPAGKSREKAKGGYKLKSNDVASNHRLAAWKAVDKHRGSNYIGLSAAQALECLWGELDEYGRDESMMEEDPEEAPAAGSGEFGWKLGGVEASDVMHHGDANNAETEDEKDVPIIDDNRGDVGNRVGDDSELVIYAVPTEYESDEEGWCLVNR
ncbi:unnamed protein product [Victoria cruziana]